MPRVSRELAAPGCFNLGHSRGSSDTGTPAYDGKQVINVPRIRTALFANLGLPRMWARTSCPAGATPDAEATRDDTVSVDGYNLFNLGARYTVGGEQGHTTLRLYADNITNKRYCRYGASYGDTFVHLGAPATIRLSAHFTF
jgi:iron complex outermembrane receptor protein